MCKKKVALLVFMEKTVRNRVQTTVREVDVTSSMEPVQDVHLGG